MEELLTELHHSAGSGKPRFAQHGRHRRFQRILQKFDISVERERFLGYRRVQEKRGQEHHQRQQNRQTRQNQCAERHNEFVEPADLIEPGETGIRWPQNLCIVFGVTCIGCRFCYGYHVVFVIAEL